MSEKSVRTHDPSFNCYDAEKIPPLQKKSDSMIKLKPLPEDGLTLTNSVEIFHDWLGFCNDNSIEKPEFLLPALQRRIELTEFSFLSRSPTMETEAVREQIPKLEPWEYTLDLSGVKTREIDEVTRPEWRFHRFRVDLIAETLARLLGDRMLEVELLDIACHCGVFSLELAARGARAVRGVDLRPENIAQARFLQRLYGIDNCTFEVGDAEYLPKREYDVILNLGLLYHVTFPMQLLQHCYDHCRICCVVDTNVYNSPFAGFYLVSGKDISISCEGKSHAEMLPTYRGLVLAMKTVGFEHVYELVASDQANQDIVSFETFNRRVLIGFKQLPENLEQITGASALHKP